MVDISSGDKKINITVSTSGNKASVNATPDTAMYYSNKSREWAISSKIVDGEDYSSKYYANVSKKQAETVKDKITEVNNAVEEGITNIINQENISVDNVNTAGETQVNLAKEQATIATTQAGIATAKTSEVIESGNAVITAITEQETTSKNNIETKGTEQIELIQNEGATQVANVQSTGFYMRDDKLYYINSRGEEVEFKLDDIELNNPFSLFDSKYSDHELNNLSWLKSNGQWNAKAVYPTAYDKLLKVYNGTETVEGLSVKLSTESYTDYDFVLNTANETFRLPLKTHTADDGNSVLTLYFYVGETVQNANLIDAGRIEEILPTKTDKVQAARASMPSSKYIDLTLGASESLYTAPANGYMQIGVNCSTSSGFVALVKLTSGTKPLSDHSNVRQQIQTKIDNTQGNCILLPVKKNDIIYLGYSNVSKSWMFRFIYAEGEVS